jgi:hypothetical protein
MISNPVARSDWVRCAACRRLGPIRIDARGIPRFDPRETGSVVRARRGRRPRDGAVAGVTGVTGRGSHRADAGGVGDQDVGGAPSPGAPPHVGLIASSVPESELAGARSSDSATDLAIFDGVPGGRCWMRYLGLSGTRGAAVLVNRPGG